MNESKGTRRAVVFANGTVADYTSLSRQLRPHDALVCVDGGLKHADALGVTPTLVIGDMDSISAQRLIELQATKSTIQYPCEKDETDLQLGLQWAADNGYQSVLLAGISGGRLDHTLANIHLLAARQWPFELCAWLPGQYLWLLTSGNRLQLNDYEGATLSLLPMSESVTGISALGVEYTLDKDNLAFGSTRGVSNVVVSRQASIEITRGRMLVILTDREQKVDSA